MPKVDIGDAEIYYEEAGYGEPIMFVPGLGGGGRFVEHRRVGDFHPGQVRGECLEVQQGFHPPLRNLRLVGRVLRVPTGTFQDVALNHRRGDAIRLPHAQI